MKLANKYPPDVGKIHVLYLFHKEVVYKLEQWEQVKGENFRRQCERASRAFFH